MSDRNLPVIEEFRANAGKVGGPFASIDLLLLHTVGARTGAARINPLAYIEDGGAFVIAATYAGRDMNPAWYANLLADPDVTIEVGDRTIAVIATAVRSGPERDRLYGAMSAAIPGFADYETRTSRVIPVVLLRPA